LVAGFHADPSGAVVEVYTLSVTHKFVEGFVGWEEEKNLLYCVGD
jgi:hypothetical protein